MLRGEAVDDADVADEIAPCFVTRNGLCTDTIVLACTHYPLLEAQFARLAPWPVTFLDPAPAIARRVMDLLGPAVQASAKAGSQFVFTSGAKPAPALEAVFSRFG